MNIFNYNLVDNIMVFIFLILHPYMSIPSHMVHLTGPINRLLSALYCHLRHLIRCLADKFFENKNTTSMAR